MAKKCYCGEPLRADGACRYRCPPEARPSALRKARGKINREQQANRVEFERIGLGQGEQSRLSEVMAKFDPVTAFKRRGAQRAAAKSHKIGARR